MRIEGSGGWGLSIWELEHRGTSLTTLIERLLCHLQIMQLLHVIRCWNQGMTCRTLPRRATCRFCGTHRCEREREVGGREKSQRQRQGQTDRQTDRQTGVCVCERETALTHRCAREKERQGFRRPVLQSSSGDVLECGSLGGGCESRGIQCISPVGLNVFKAHRLLYHSTLGSRVTKKKKSTVSP